MTSLFDVRASGSKRPEIAILSYRQLPSFRVGRPELSNRKSADEATIRKTITTPRNNNNINNNYNGVENPGRMDKSSSNCIANGTATLTKPRVKPVRSNGGMGMKSKHATSMPDLVNVGKELTVAPSLQNSCRIFRSDSTMPPVLVAKRIPLSPGDEAEFSLLDRRLEELLVSGDIPELERFLQGQQRSSEGAPVLVNTRLESLSTPQGADLTDCTPLGLAIIRNDHLLISALIRLGADVTMAPCIHRDVTTGSSHQRDVMTPFHLAAMRFCSLDVMKALLNAGGVEKTDQKEESDVKENRTQDCEIDPLKIGEMGVKLIPADLFFPVLQYVAKCTDGKLSRRILGAVGSERLGEYINVKNEYGKSALHVACKEGSGEGAKLLIEKGIDVNGRDKARKTALMYAARRGRADNTVKLILASGGDVTAVDCSGRSALHFSVLNEHLTTTEILLKAGADPTLPDLSKSTPLDHALNTISKNSSGRIGASEARVLTLLVENTKSRLELSETNFRTACTCLIDRYSDSPDAGTFATLKRLCADHPNLTRSPDPSTKETLLHYACRYAYASSVVQWLVTTYMGGADLDAPGDEGYPPLLLAVRVGATDSAAILLRSGANPNVVTSQIEPIWSGLWLALCRGNGELARELIAAGARTDGEMSLRFLRIAGARQGQQAVTADDPLVLLAGKNSGKVTPFEFALHKCDLITAHKLMTSLKVSPYVMSQDKRKLTLDLLARCRRVAVERDGSDGGLGAEIEKWINTGNTG